MNQALLQNKGAYIKTTAFDQSEKKNREYTEDNNEESVLFDVCRQVFVRSANRQLSKFFILIPTGSHRTGIIFDHAGLSHEGLDSNNFVVAQHTTYFEISSFSTNSEDSCFIL